MSLTNFSHTQDKQAGISKHFLSLSIFIYTLCPSNPSEEALETEFSSQEKCEEVVTGGKINQAT